MQLYKYNREKGLLEAVPPPEPDTWDYCPNDYDFDEERYNSAYKLWEWKIASLPQYTVSREFADYYKDAPEDKRYEEGEHFYMGRADGSTYMTLDRNAQWFAWPWPIASEHQADDQNKLWKEIGRQGFSEGRPGDLTRLIRHLQENYTIQRKGG